MNNDTTKQCRMCHRLLPLSEFQKGYAKCRKCYSIYTGHMPKEKEDIPDGYRRCTKCQFLYRETSEFFYADKRAGIFRSQCKKCMDAKSIEYHRENQPIIRAYHHNWSCLNRDKINERSRKNSKKHRETRRLCTQRARKNNPEAYRASMHRRLARQHGLPDTLTTQDWQRALDYFHGCCAVCGRQLQDLFGTHTVAADHWIPLSSPNCPGTVVTNIIPLCHQLGGCNNSKGNKDPLRWLEQRFGKRKAKQILKRIEEYFEWVTNS